MGESSHLLEFTFQKYSVGPEDFSLIEEIINKIGFLGFVKTLQNMDPE